MKVRDILQIMHENHDAEVFTNKGSCYGSANKILESTYSEMLDAEVINIEIANDDNTINIIANEGTEESK